MEAVSIIAHKQYASLATFIRRMEGVFSLVGKVSPARLHTSIRAAISEARRSPEPAADAIIVDFLVALGRHRVYNEERDEFVDMCGQDAKEWLAGFISSPDFFGDWQVQPQPHMPRS